MARLLSFQTAGGNDSAAVPSWGIGAGSRTSSALYERGTGLRIALHRGRYVDVAV